MILILCRFAVRELCSYLRISKPEIFERSILSLITSSTFTHVLLVLFRFPEFQLSLKIHQKFRGMTSPWKLRSPSIVSMDPKDFVLVQALYTDEQRAEFDLSAALRGSLCSSSDLNTSPEWLCSLVCDGPRNRIIKASSSIEEGTKVVQYCVDDTYLYGAVVSIHQHTIFPHPASNVYVMFKLQPWTVEPGHLGP